MSPGRILWQSTAPWGPTSYSVLTKRVVPHLVRLGYEVAINSWFGLQGQPQFWPIRENGKADGKIIGNVTIFPCVNGNSFAQDTMAGIYKMVKADLLVICSDAWVFDPNITRTMNYIHWLPIDCDPAPAAVVRSVSSAIKPLVYSQWGADVLKKDNPRAEYLPCSADIQVYKPMNKKEARRMLGMPEDKFIISIVSANKDGLDRKGFSEGLAAFKKFSRYHDDAMLYIHTEWNGPIKIENMVNSLGLKDRVLRPDALPYALGMLNDEYMRRIYCAADVLFNPAKSEGFGLPMLEAQMCGCPVAATDFSTTREIVKAGWYIDGQMHWSLGNDSWRMTIYVDSAVECLEEAYKHRDDKELRERARDASLKYDTFSVAERFWKPTLRGIFNDIEEGRRAITVEESAVCNEPLSQPVECATG